MLIVSHLIRIIDSDKILDDLIGNENTNECVIILNQMFHHVIDFRIEQSENVNFYILAWLIELWQKTSMYITPEVGNFDMTDLRNG